MDWMIEYYKERETDPIEFLKYFRRTTEPIGGGTEPADDGELTDWDAAVVAVDIAKKQMIDNTVKWLDSIMYYVSKEDKRLVCNFSDFDGLINDFKQSVMEE